LVLTAYLIEKTSLLPWSYILEPLRRLMSQLCYEVSERSVSKRVSSWYMLSTHEAAAALQKHGRRYVSQIGAH